MFPFPQCPVLNFINKEIFKMNTYSSFLKTIFYATCLLITVGSCNKADYLDVDPSNRPPIAAKISFVNARPESQGVIFWTYTTQVTASVPVNTATQYMDAQFGLVQINISNSPTSSYLASRVFGGAATFSSSGGPNGPIAGYYHTVFAAKASASNFTADSLILFYDDLTAPAAGKAKIRFVHLAPKTGAVDVVFAGTKLFSSVGYGAAGGAVLSGAGLNAFSIGPYLTVDAATGKLSVETAGTGTALDVKNTQLDALNLQSGKIYTIFINGNAGNIGATILQHN
jgi:hypothetical protein